MIKTKFSYTEQALQAYFLFHLRRKDKIKWFYYGVSLLFVVLSAIVAFVFDKYLFALLVLIAAIIMLLLFPYQTKKIAKKTTSARYKRPPQDIIFDEKQIEQIIDKQKRIYNWPEILEINETPLYMYFYISKNSAIIVDKTTITENEYLALIELIKINQKKHYLYRK